MEEISKVSGQNKHEIVSIIENKSIAKINKNPKRRDYFYTPSFSPASTWSWNHGNAGIYLNNGSMMFVSLKDLVEDNDSEIYYTYEK